MGGWSSGRAGGLGYAFLPHGDWALLNLRGVREGLCGLVSQTQPCLSALGLAGGAATGSDSPPRPPVGITLGAVV